MVSRRRSAGARRSAGLESTGDGDESCCCWAEHGTGHLADDDRAVVRNGAVSATATTPARRVSLAAPAQPRRPAHGAGHGRNTASLRPVRIPRRRPSVHCAAARARRCAPRGHAVGRGAPARAARAELESQARRSRPRRRRAQPRPRRPRHRASAKARLVLVGHGEQRIDEERRSAAALLDLRSARGGRPADRQRGAGACCKVMSRDPDKRGRQQLCRSPLPARRPCASFRPERCMRSTEGRAFSRSAALGWTPRLVLASQAAGAHARNGPGGLRCRRPWPAGRCDAGQVGCHSLQRAVDAEDRLAWKRRESCTVPWMASRQRRVSAASAVDDCGRCRASARKFVHLATIARWSRSMRHQGVRMARRGKSFWRTKVSHCGSA